MATQEQIIAEQQTQIKEMKRIISVLDTRIRHLEKNARSAAALVNNNTRDIRNTAVQVENIKTILNRGG